jgi:acetylornithine deacetylase/succinyl-diaminopimelate desuccinylase-like protein
VSLATDSNLPQHLTEMEQLIDERREAYLLQLFTLLRQKSISAQNIGIRETAEMLRGMMEDIGINARLIETKGHPVVYGELISHPGAFTLLIYGHYDVQPAELADGWNSPPFEPEVRDGRIYCRGAGDNKGQLMAQLLAVKTYLDVNPSLPVNVKFMFEGEEESGSPNLAAFVEQHKDLLACQLVYTSDGPLHETGLPMVVLGVRGMLYVELTCQTAKWDNHSGNKGNIVPNPAMRLVQLVASMRDGEDGRILIDGFYDNVKHPTEAELLHLRNLPYDNAQAGRQAGYEQLDMEPETYYRRLMYEPTLNICGFTSGYGGEGSKTIIPAKATVKMDMRLVAGQDPDDIYQKFCAHVKRHAAGVEIQHLGDMKPSRTPADLPLVQDVITAVESAYRQRPVVAPALGGSLPDYVWTQILGVPSVLVPYANSDEANHSPNENIGVENFFNGIRCTCHVIDRLGR